MLIRHCALPRDAQQQIAGAETLESSNRQLAAECLLTLCEAREKAPGMMRKLPQFLDSFFQCLLAFLHDIEVLHLVLQTGLKACESALHWELTFLYDIKVPHWVLQTVAEFVKVLCIGAEHAG